MFARPVARKIRGFATAMGDALFIGGIAAVTYGIHQISGPWAWIFAGAAAAVVGALMEPPGESQQ
jgi:hypothetical protein